MRNIQKTTFLIGTVTFVLLNLVQAQQVVQHEKKDVSQKQFSTLKDTFYQKVVAYNPAERPRFRLLFDYYHHNLPSTKVGNHIVTGSWVDDNGRYGWDDFVHTNTFDPVYTALEKEYSISMSKQPYSNELLAQTDAVIIINADNPDIVPGAHLISDREIANLQQYVNNGGSLMIMVNSGGVDRANEGFEKVQLRKLVRGFGLDWNEDDTHYSDNVIGTGHPNFYDVPVFHYGSGCTIRILPEANKPEVLLDVYSDAGYPDRKISGPGIVMVRPGKGKFILVGDVGSWTGNISRPWAENERILKQLFRYLKPSRGVVAPQLDDGKTWTYEVTVSGLQGVPVANSLSQVARPHYRVFSPRKITNMPYFERSAVLQLNGKKNSKNKATEINAKLSNVRWFDEKVENTSDQHIRFTASRQGKVSDVQATGLDAQWLAPDLPVVIALLPVDGLSPGDRWESIESLRIPILRGSDLPPVKSYPMEITYVRDESVGGKPCRLLRSSGEVWLDELGVKVEDLLPVEEIHRVGGSNYKFLSEHGGKLLFKREQWVDQETGIVVKARLQSRIVAWIHDKRKPVNLSNADKDNNMIVSLAHIVTITMR